MTKWIRGWGLIVFLVIVLGLLGGIYFFADALIKRVVESVGTNLNAAQVELANAHLSFSPFGFTLGNLQVTDAQEPMRNAVQIERIRFSMEFLELLRSKVIIQDMSMEGVRLHTPRTHSGAIPKEATPPQEPPAKSFWEDVPLPAIDLPGAKELVEKEDLQSVKLAQQLREELARAKDDWVKRVAELPDAQVFAQYDAKLKLAKPSFKGNALEDVQEIEAAVQRLQALRDDIRKDVARIQEAKQTLTKDLDTWSTRSKEMLAAPGADIERLKGKYSLDAKGLSNASRGLFGGEVAAWSNTTLYWYDKLKPVLANVRRMKEQEPAPPRRKGVDVRFPDTKPLPDFLIRSMSAGVDVPAGLMKGQIHNITSDQAVLGHPLTFNFFGEKMHGLQDLELEGTLNHVNPQAPLDVVQLQARGIAVDNFVLSKQKNLPISLTQTRVDLTSKVELRDSALSADLSANFQPAKFTVSSGDKPNELVKALAQALGEVNKFQVSATLRGTLKDIDMNLRSDLDETLRTALSRQLKQRIAQFQSELQARINDKISAARQDIEARLKEVKGLDQTVDQRRKQGEEMLQRAENELRAVLEKQKTELERQRKAGEDKIKQEADAQKQKAQEKAQQGTDKFKDRLKDRLKF